MLLPYLVYVLSAEMESKQLWNFNQYLLFREISYSDSLVIWMDAIMTSPYSVLHPSKKDCISILFQYLDQVRLYNFDQGDHTRHYFKQLIVATTG